MLSAVLVVALAAPVKVAVPGIRVVGMDEKRAGFFNEHLAQQLDDRGVRTVTPEQIAALIGLERQKQLLACSDTNCTAELAGALGVDALVLGSIARIGSVIQLDLKAIDSRTGEKRGSYSARVKSDDELLDKLDDGARALAEQLGAVAPAGQVKANSSGGVPRFAFLPPLVIGAAMVAASFGVLIASLGDFQNIVNATPQMPLSLTDADVMRSRGHTEQTVGWVGIGIGAAAMAAGVVLLILRPSEPVAVTLAPAPNGAALVGVFP